MESSRRPAPLRRREPPSWGRGAGPSPSPLEKRRHRGGHDLSSKARPQAPNPPRSEDSGASPAPSIHRSGALAKLEFLPPGVLPTRSSIAPAAANLQLPHFSRHERGSLSIPAQLQRGTRGARRHLCRQRGRKSAPVPGERWRAAPRHRNRPQPFRCGEETRAPAQGERHVGGSLRARDPSFRKDRARRSATALEAGRRAAGKRTNRWPHKQPPHKSPRPDDPSAPPRDLQPEAAGEGEPARRRWHSRRAPNARQPAASQAPIRLARAANESGSSPREARRLWRATASPDASRQCLKTGSKRAPGPLQSEWGAHQRRTGASRCSSRLPTMVGGGGCLCAGEDAEGKRLLVARAPSPLRPKML